MRSRTEFCNINLLTVIWIWSISFVTGIRENHENWRGATYDFIVVGAGTAGCTVASRLAKSGKHTVLLIEAGGLPHPELEIPALSAKYSFNPNYVRIIHAIPSETAALSRNGVLTYGYGQTLGGSSSINAMMFNRGSPHDYNNWADLTGDKSWNYDNMLKYFRKYENYSGDYPSDQRGNGGPITISTPRYAPGLRQWLGGGKELGLVIAEPNGPQQISFANIDFTKNRGRRVTAFTGYIKPMLDSEEVESFSNWERSTENSNLIILINTRVNQIIFEGDRAVGVRFTTNFSSDGVHLGEARATKEIILSSGTIGSTELLQKSGIGPRSVLEEAKIPVIKDLPVGKNFQDHPALQLTVIVNDSSIVFDEMRDLTPENYEIYNRTGDGPYSAYGGILGQAFIMSGTLTEKERILAWPNLHLVYSGAAIINNAQLGFQQLEPDELAAGEVAIKWSGIVGRPKSRGYVKLNASDVDTPIIDFGFLTHPDDLADFVESMKFLSILCERTTTYQRVGCRLPRSPYRPCQHETYLSDKYWECLTRHLVNSLVHGVGTCRMGKQNDPESVVDPELRVIGVKSLRICDGSIIPVITNANTQAPIYAIAEKGAELILKTWEQKHHNRFYG